MLKRDRFICYLCGRPGADEVDHVVSLANGGTDDLSNLRAVHGVPCHRRKTAREANEQRWKNATTKRAPERHPGLR